MKTHKVDAMAVEYYKKSGDLIIECDDFVDFDGYKDERTRQFLVKAFDFTQTDFEDQLTLADIPEREIVGYVHAQIVDENADSLLLNLPHPYTGEDNLFRVEKKTEEVEEAEDDPEAEILQTAEKIINEPSLFMELFSKSILEPGVWVDTMISKVVKDCTCTLQIPEEVILRQPMPWLQSYTKAAAAGAKARDQAIDKMWAEHKSRFLSACDRQSRKEVAEKDFRELRDHLIEKASPDRQTLLPGQDYAQYVESLPDAQLERHAEQFGYHKPDGVTIQGFREYLIEQIEKEKAK